MAYLGLGTNLGSRAEMLFCLEEAARLLHASDGIKVVGRSSVRETQPWGVTDQPNFLNMALAVETVLQPGELLSVIKKIEHDMGRTKTYKWGPREIDIDILLFGMSQTNTVDLTIPHKHLLERRFAWEPVLELNSKVRFPDGRFLAELVQQEDSK